jgi:hypothetical protein
MFLPGDGSQWVPAWQHPVSGLFYWLNIGAIVLGNYQFDQAPGQEFAMLEY